MSMKNVISSLALLFILSGCDNKAEAVVEDEPQVEPQEQYEQGHIETHSTE